MTSLNCTLEPSADRSYILGVDLGTTSVKVCIVDSSTLQCVKQMSKDTQANVPSELGSEGDKQYVPKIVSALHNVVSRLPRDALRRVVKIAVCGQMHGCVLWKSNSAWSRKPDSSSWQLDQVSHLYTWQDTRCCPEFLSSLPPPDSHLSVHSGYGLATLLWFCRHRPDKLAEYDRAGTVQDLVVSMLCDLDRPVMSVHNAASWGYFNTQTQQWNSTILQSAGLPEALLPRVVEAGSVAGHLSAVWENISSGTAVLAALGDMQCSLLPLLAEPSISAPAAALNVSTSAQMALLLPDTFSVSSLAPTNTDCITEACGEITEACSGITKECGGTTGACRISYLPFTAGRYLAVASALTGGNALASFVRLLQSWTTQLGFSIPQSSIWEKLLKLSSASTDSITDATAPSSTAAAALYIVPTLHGERHVPERRASVGNIDSFNTAELGAVYQAVCRGIADNLDSMMPSAWLRDHGVRQINGTGSALCRNPALLKAFQQVYGLPVVLAPTVTSAAYGAALLAAKYAN